MTTVETMERLESPETTEVLSTPELLLRHDPDPYGYVAQAAETLKRIHNKTIDDDTQDAYASVARFASDKFDAELMQDCLEYIPDPARRWQLFAYELEHQRYAIDVPTLVEWGRELADIEMTPEATRDYLSLAKIYRAQLEISYHTGSDNFDEVYQKFSKSFEKLTRQEDTRDIRVLRCDSTHMFLEMGMFDRAAKYARGMYHDDYERYQLQAPLYQQMQKGRQPNGNFDLRTAAFFRKHFPAHYVEMPGVDIEPSWGGAVLHDVRPLLEAGKLTQASRIYEKALPYSNDYSVARVETALQLARYPRDEETMRDTSSRMEGYCKLVKQIEDAPDNDRGTSPLNQLESASILMCADVKALPYSSQRIAYSLEIAGVCRNLLSQSGMMGKMCDEMLANIWLTARATLVGNFEKELPQPLKDLWEQLAESGLTPDTVAQYRQG